jgi:hypothetical protein
MTRRVRKIIKQCEDWPREERAALAAGLIDGLQDGDGNVLAEWDEEIAKRVEDLEPGRVSGVPATVVHRRLQKVIDGDRVSSSRRK